MDNDTLAEKVQDVLTQSRCEGSWDYLNRIQRIGMRLRAIKVAQDKLDRLLFDDLAPTD